MQLPSGAREWRDHARGARGISLEAEALQRRHVIRGGFRKRAASVIGFLG
jgi:hypothetical protein